jgi:hypothetical protein
MLPQLSNKRLSLCALTSWARFLRVSGLVYSAGSVGGVRPAAETADLGRGTLPTADNAGAQMNFRATRASSPSQRANLDKEENKAKELYKQAQARARERGNRRMRRGGKKNRAFHPT